MATKTKKQNDQLVSLNLATKPGRERAQKIHNDMESDFVLSADALSADDRYNFDAFVAGQTMPITFGNKPLVFEGSNTFVVNGNAIYGFDHATSRIDQNTIDDACNQPPSALVVGGVKKRNKSNQNAKVFLLVNGDESGSFGEPDGPEYPLVGELDRFEFPTFSFNCFSRFYKSEDEAMTAFDKGHVRLLDFTADSRKSLTAAERKILNTPVPKGKKRKPLLPPEPGYSLVGEEWHRSATVLLHDTQKGWTLLIGQDEGTYFGVELPKGKYATIQDAYEALIPEEARGTEFKRQGEWFAVPVDLDEVPAEPDCAMVVEGPDAETVYLPLETVDSNKHGFEGGTIRFGRDGRVYAEGVNLVHDEHATMELSEDRWYTFYKNTAIRSFSQKGVD